MTKITNEQLNTFLVERNMNTPENKQKEYVGIGTNILKPLIITREGLSIKVMLK